MAVPLLDLCAQNLPLESELRNAFDRVLASGHFIMGPDVGFLEAEIASLVGAKYAIGVSSGTDAILLALMALGIEAGDEVLCPSFTFFATAGCIARVGAKPVFVDSDPATFNISVAEAKRKLTSRTKAIIPVHLFGQCAEMDSIMELARSNGLFVIEDAAQSLGARYKGRFAGTLGDFGSFSFFPSKNLGAFGDAGLIVTNDDGLREKASILRTHGSKPKYYHKYIGGNFRIDTLQAALLRVKLPHYHRYTEQRKANAAYYSDKLSQIDGVTFQTGENDSNTRLILPKVQDDRDHIWNQYTLRVPGKGRRDQLRRLLTEAGIGTEIYYPRPMHLQDCFSQSGAAVQSSCPVAELLANEVLSIPIYPELTTAQQEAVVRQLSISIDRVPLLD